MERIEFKSRENWRQICQDSGFSFHTPDNKPYWIENNAYVFTKDEISKIKDATKTLYNMCLNVVNFVVNNPEYLFKLKIPEQAHKFIIHSWKNRDIELYSRFDLMLGNNGEIKMAEINAQTPQSILEAGRIQRNWAEHFNVLQYNNITEKLYDAFQDLGIYSLHFTCVNNEIEDREGVKYIQDCCSLYNKFLYIEEIGWDGKNFLDLQNKIITNIFLLYPFEWLVEEEFFNNITFENFKPINPWWTYILTSKGILPILWELYPNNEYLLPAFWNKPEKGKFVSKSLFGREGSNISIIENDETLFSSYDNNYSNVFGDIYQEFFDIKQFDGFTPIIGSWIINSEACGIGMREDNNIITTVNGHFVPHLVKG